MGRLLANGVLIVAVLAGCWLFASPGASADDVCSSSVFATSPGQAWNYSYLEDLDESLTLDNMVSSPTQTLLFAPAHRPRSTPGNSSNSRSTGRPPLLYCWIPKNACSMFKLLFLRLILDDGAWRRWQESHQNKSKEAAHSVEELYPKQFLASKVALAQLLATQDAAARDAARRDAALRDMAGRDMVGRRIAGQDEARRDEARRDQASDDGAAAHSKPAGALAVPGIVIVRNPYVRVLSGYLHLVANAAKDGLQTAKFHTDLLKGHGFEAVPTFPEWVMRLRQLGMRRVNRHFKPQNHFCGMGAGVRFKYQVKLESLAATYPCLVRELGLGPWVDSQWAGFYPGQDCFYKPSPDMPCTWWRDALEEQQAGQAAGTDALALLAGKVDETMDRPVQRPTSGMALLQHVDGAGSGTESTGAGDLVEGHHLRGAGGGSAARDSARDGGSTLRLVHRQLISDVTAESASHLQLDGSTAPHRTDAVKLLFEYYDERTAALVTSLYRRDFELFGYQTWAGPPHPIHVG